MLSAICFALYLLSISLRYSFCYILDRRSSLLFYLIQYVRLLSNRLAKIVLVYLKLFVNIAILISNNKYYIYYLIEQENNILEQYI
jgi:hypothetical protein